MPDLQQIGHKQQIAKEEVLVALQNILRSDPFSHSSSLRDTLEFIVRNSFSSSPEPVKEYSIATQVLGRRVDFNPKVDNIVRVQMHRLREKLEQYYLTDGQQEPIRILIPLGQYNAEYVRNTAALQTTTTNLVQPSNVSPVKRRRLDWRWGVIFASVICNVVLLVSLLKPSAKIPSAFSFLWQPFLSLSTPPLIVYSNPVFAMTERGNLYRFSSPRILSMPRGTIIPTGADPQVYPVRGEETGPYYYCDAYTGTGEVVGAARVVRFLTGHGEPFLIKRSRLISFGDITHSNVIFLGSEKEDQILRNLPNVAQLVYEPPPPNQYSTGSYIHDLKPLPGHPANYRVQVSPQTSAILADYGLISLLPGVSEDQYILVLGGITTLGTEASADFVTSAHNMVVLGRMLAAAEPRTPRSPFFQALLRVEVRDGVPLHAKCLFVRDLNQQLR